MSELVPMVQELLNLVKSQGKQIHELQVMVMKNKVDDTWISEEIAAEMIGYDGRTFRRWVKAGKLPIDFRNTNGRRYQYNRKSILRYKENTSVQA